MANAFTLWGSLKADTGAFERAMKSSDRLVIDVGRDIEKTGQSAAKLGTTSATTARQFEKLNEKLAMNRNLLHDAAKAFQTGDISAKRMAATFLQVEKSTLAASSRIKDLKAQMADLGSKGRLGGVFSDNAFLAGISGGFVGAGAVGAGLAAFSLTQKLAGAVADLGQRSVQAAADFQQTRSAMLLYAGSASKAKDELDALANLSRKTSGLGLVDAEKGALRLRALGFQAGVVQDLLAGLAKQKILSGVGSDAIDRVTLNLAQLASGGGDMADVKELITNLPTIRKEITDAFGSLSGFREALAADPTGSIAKLVNELKNVQSPAGGANDALQKLYDSFTTIGRDFGTPILEPFTMGLNDLTSTVYANRSAFESWGKTVSEQLRGVVEVGRGIGAVNDASGGWLGWLAGEGISRGAMQQLPQSLQLALSGLKLIGAEAERVAKANAKVGGLAGGILNLAPMNLGSLQSQKEAALDLIKIKSQAAKENSDWFVNAYSKLIDRQAGGLAGLRNLVNGIQKNSYLQPEAKGDILFQYQQRIDQMVKQGTDKVKELGKSYREALSGTISNYGSMNPFVKVLFDADSAMSKLRENTQGLSADLRASLAGMQATANAANLLTQRVNTRLEALNLSDQAKQFRQGFRFADTDSNLQASVDRMLKAIGGGPGFASDTFNIAANGALQQITNPFNSLMREVADRAAVSNFANLDPARLRFDQRNVIAGAFEREAGRKASQEGEAVALMNRQVALQEQINERLEVLLDVAKRGGLSSLDLTIKDETAGGTRIGNAQSVNARYR